MNIVRYNDKQKKLSKIRAIWRDVLWVLEQNKMLLGTTYKKSYNKVSGFKYTIVESALVLDENKIVEMTYNGKSFETKQYQLFVNNLSNIAWAKTAYVGHNHVYGYRREVLNNICGIPDEDKAFIWKARLCFDKYLERYHQLRQYDEPIVGAALKSSSTYGAKVARYMPTRTPRAVVDHSVYLYEDIFYRDDVIVREPRVKWVLEQREAINALSGYILFEELRHLEGKNIEGLQSTLNQLLRHVNPDKLQESCSRWLSRMPARAFARFCAEGVLPLAEEDMEKFNLLDRDVVRWCWDKIPALIRKNRWERIDELVDADIEGNPSIDEAFRRVAARQAVAQQQMLKRKRERDINQYISDVLARAGLTKIEFESEYFTQLYTPQHLVKEGRSMHHCVGLYPHHLANLQSFFFHYKEGEIEGTIQLGRDAEIIQFYGPCNNRLDETHWEIARSFANEVKPLIKARISYIESLGFKKRLEEKYIPKEEPAVGSITQRLGVLGQQLNEVYDPFADEEIN